MDRGAWQSLQSTGLQRVEPSEQPEHYRQFSWCSNLTPKHQTWRAGSCLEHSTGHYHFSGVGGFPTTPFAPDPHGLWSSWLLCPFQSVLNIQGYLLLQHDTSEVYFVDCPLTWTCLMFSPDYSELIHFSKKCCVLGDRNRDNTASVCLLANVHIDIMVRWISPW